MKASGAADDSNPEVSHAHLGPRRQLAYLTHRVVDTRLPTHALLTEECNNIRIEPQRHAGLDRLRLLRPALATHASQALRAQRPRVLPELLRQRRIIGVGQRRGSDGGVFFIRHTVRAFARHAACLRPASRPTLSLRSLAHSLVVPSDWPCAG